MKQTVLRNVNSVDISHLPVSTYINCFLSVHKTSKIL